MTPQAVLRRAVLIGAAVFAVSALPLEGASLAHHDVATAQQQTGDVEYLMELADRACFGHGDDLTGLQEEAKERGWKPVSAQELERRDTSASEMTGGWVFTNAFGSFAIMQSKFKDGPAAYLCSITTKLAFHRHDQVKASFEQRFKAPLVQEGDRSGKHTDRFLITSPSKAPIDSSIVYVPSKGGITINMIHGRDSGPAASLRSKNACASFSGSLSRADSRHARRLWLSRNMPPSLPFTILDSS